MISTRDLSQTQVENKGIEKIFYANNNQKKDAVAIAVSYKIDFKTKDLQKTKKDIKL